jgi:hypothetical protein
MVRFRPRHLFDNTRQPKASHIASPTRSPETPVLPPAKLVRRSLSDRGLGEYHRKADRQPYTPPRHDLHVYAQTSRGRWYAAAPQLMNTHSTRAPNHTVDGKPVSGPLYHGSMLYRTVSSPHFRRVASLQSGAVGENAVYSVIRIRSRWSPKTCPHPLFGPYICPFSLDAKEGWVEQ